MRVQFRMVGSWQLDIPTVIWLGGEHFHEYETSHLSLAHLLWLRGTDTVWHYRPYGGTYPHILEPLADISCHRDLLGQWQGKEIEVIIKRRSGGVIHWKFKHEFLIWYYQIIINFFLHYYCRQCDKRISYLETSLQEFDILYDIIILILIFKMCQSDAFCYEVNIWYIFVRCVFDCLSYKCQCL